MQPRASLRVLSERIGRAVALFTAGGGWTAQLAPAVRRNLRWYYFDGVLASSQEAINATYLTLFVLALGATKSQIGLMASLASGLMTALGGLGHALPYLIPDFWTATTIAFVVVFVELWAIAWIQNRFMETPFLRAVFQVVLGGALVFGAGVLIGGG